MSDEHKVDSLSTDRSKPEGSRGTEQVRRYHLCLDVRGALMNWTNRRFKGVFQHDDGREMTPMEARKALMEEMAKGRKVIPCAPCDNFDYQHGCQGHPVQGEGEE